MPDNQAPIAGTGGSTRRQYQVAVHMPPQMAIQGQPGPAHCTLHKSHSWAHQDAGAVEFWLLSGAPALRAPQVCRIILAIVNLVARLVLVGLHTASTRQCALWDLCALWGAPESCQSELREMHAQGGYPVCIVCSHASSAPCQAASLLGSGQAGWLACMRACVQVIHASRAQLEAAMARHARRAQGGGSSATNTPGSETQGGAHA